MTVNRSSIILKICSSDCFNVSYTAFNVWVLINGVESTAVIKHELRVTSCELRVASYELRAESLKARVEVQKHELKLRVRILEFKNH